MQDSSDDKELLRGCAEGKKEAWDLFVDRFSKLIHWSIRRTLENTSFGSRQDLQAEIFQDVFQKLLEKEELVKLREVAGLRKFISVMACHRTLDKLKSLSRRENRTLSFDAPREEGSAGLETPDVSKNAAGQAMNRETENGVRAALAKLPARERSCVELHYLDGKTHREIGELLRMPTDTVSTILRRTKEKLKKEFTDNGWNLDG